MVILGALLIWYTLVGFLIAPALIQHFGEKQLKAKFSSESAITKVRINPFTGSLRVEGLQLADAEGAWSLAWGLAELDIGAATFVKLYPVIDAIRLDGADIRYEKRPFEGDEVKVVEKEQAGDWREVVNELNLTEIPKLRVDLLEVSAGRVEFTDLTNPEIYAKTLDSINFALRDLTTVAEKGSEMSFVAETDRGARLSWKGNFQSKPIRSAGRFALTGLAVHDLSPYFDQFIRFNLRQAFFGLSFDYELNLADLEHIFRIQTGQVSLTELHCEVSDASDRVISVESIIADGLGFAFPQMEFGVASVRISDGESRIFRDSGGESTYRGLSHCRRSLKTMSRFRKNLQRAVCRHSLIRSMKSSLVIIV